MPVPTIPLTYILETPRCRLRAPSEADLPHIFEATRYGGFNEGMLWDPPDTLDELQEPLRRSLAAWEAGEAFGFSIDLREPSLFVGRISIRPAGQPNHWNIGFWMHPEQQGNGYTREAAAAILHFGFEVLEAEAIEACYATWNMPSERVLTTIGMTFQEHIPLGFKKHGAWVAENRMAITRQSWQGMGGEAL
jgi:ribosomal-protein-alanine N-acetyltransferase